MVYGQGGLEETSYETDIDKAWPYPGTKQEYWQKSTPDPRLDDVSINATIFKAKQRINSGNIYDLILNLSISQAVSTSQTSEEKCKLRCPVFY